MRRALRTLPFFAGAALVVALPLLAIAQPAGPPPAVPSEQARANPQPSASPSATSSATPEQGQPPPTGTQPAPTPDKPPSGDASPPVKPPSSTTPQAPDKPPSSTTPPAPDKAPSNTTSPTPPPTGKPSATDTAPKPPGAAAQTPPAREAPSGETGPAGAKAPSFLDRFAGSYVQWDHAVNTGYFGAGAYYSGIESFAYTTSVILSPSFFLYRSPRHQVRATTALTVLIDAADTLTTSTTHEPNVLDLPLTLTDAITLGAWGGTNVAPAGPSETFDPALQGGGEMHAWLLTGGSLIFPTSKASQSATRALATSLTAGLRQRIRLLGGRSQALPHATLSLTETWRHDFFRTDAGGFDSPTPLPTGEPVEHHAGFAPTTSINNRFLHRLSLLLPLYGGLELTADVALRHDLRDSSAPPPCIQLPTGCADTPYGNPDTAVLTFTQFDIALAYRVLPEVVVAVGYDSFTSTVGIDGQGTKFIGEPSALFYADLTLFPERFFHRFLPPAPPTTAR